MGRGTAIGKGSGMASDRSGYVRQRAARQRLDVISGHLGRQEASGACEGRQADAVHRNAVPRRRWVPVRRVPAGRAQKYACTSVSGTANAAAAWRVRADKGEPGSQVLWRRRVLEVPVWEGSWTAPGV